jgi:hypothetical protein
MIRRISVGAEVPDASARIEPAAPRIVAQRRMRLRVGLGVQAFRQALVMLVARRFDSRFASLVALPRAVFAARFAALR